MIGSVSVPSFQELNRLISGLEEDTRVSLQVTATVVYNQRVTSLDGRPYDIVLIQSEGQTRLVRNFTNMVLTPGFPYRMILSMIKGPYDVSLFLESCMEMEGKRVLTQVKGFSQVKSDQELKGLVITENLLIKDLRDDEKARVFILQNPDNPKHTYYLNVWRDDTNSSLLRPGIDTLIGHSLRVDKVLCYKKKDSSTLSLKFVRNISKVGLVPY